MNVIAFASVLPIILIGCSSTTTLAPEPVAISDSVPIPTPVPVAEPLNVNSEHVIKVAAYNSPASIQANADYLCDGTDDQVEIQAAIDSLTSGGGTVELSEGIFHYR